MLFMFLINSATVEATCFILNMKTRRHYLFNADDMYNKPEDGIQVLGGIVEITTCRSSV